ncbi:MAG TPA: carboxylating nicotinate-nucleotide diphosphorylase [Vicinamibacteria bacterium]|nr:carboxylating nicotinate-nucleotide diphosphorylase [Vicinamibacteria bacterium]
MELRELVAAALAEDIGPRDVTAEATVPAETRARGTLLAKQDLVLAGLEAARAAFEMRVPGLAWEPRFADGDRIRRGSVIVTLAGDARGLLSAERVALNFLQQACGVATLTRLFVDAVAGTKARVRDTRKTLPLLRSLQKRAVALGGGEPHRTGLATGVLIKDNHVRLAGSAEEATRRAVAAGTGLPVEAEVERLDQIEGVLAAGAHMLLLDNFTPEQVREAVALVAGRVPVEVSGGVRLDNVRAHAEAGADFIAIGALTHSAPAADISLELEPQ